MSVGRKTCVKYVKYVVTVDHDVSRRKLLQCTVKKIQKIIPFKV